jgi:hypothetical protein
MVGAGPSARPQTTISSLAVDIWPEHDDPRLLVIYRGTLSADAPLPQTLAFPIPAGAQVNASAYRTADGQLWSAPSQYHQAGNQLTVAFTIEAHGFQFEYYIDAIAGLPQRSFALDLVLPLAVESLKVSVEQPLRSSAFILTPPAGGTIAAPGGFTHYLFDVGRLPAGKAWSVRATYRKTDRNPSVARVVQVPGPGVAGQAPGGSTGMPGWLWGAGAAVVLGIAGVGVLGYRRGWWAPGRHRPVTTSRRPSARDERAPRARPRAYCHQCGARVRPRDRFCSHCGRPLSQA